MKRTLKNSKEITLNLGINNANNFDEYWDGRLVEVLGYLVIHTDMQRNELVNYIYLIEGENKNYQEIIKHTKMFASGICVYAELIDLNFIIRKTDVYQKAIGSNEVVEFIKSVITQDIPDYVFDE
ncbi:hypothetical protein LG307_11910 [Sutcliffiella horikoshii]|uniref:hypothetical protein n=1 Tax=Sutcliffiella horikoshii TaxID=79883 RepID=UPI00384D9F17